MSEKFFNAGMQPPNVGPTARIAPVEQRKVVSARALLDGRGSTDPENEPLTYTWSFVSVPIGSELTSADLAAANVENSAVTFSPDVTGPYVVQLVVSDGQFDSPPAESLVNVAAVQSPVCSDILPDGRFFFRVISDFWEDVEGREMLPIIWSSYVQMAAAELLEAFQVDYDKSIETILEQRQIRWAGYSPRLDLEPQDHYIVFGHQKDGSLASTGAIGDPSSGYVRGSRDFVVVEGAIREGLVGEELTLLSGPNQGDYTIGRVASGRYVIEQDVLFPFPAASVLASAADLVTTKDSDQVSSASTDFSAVVGLETGDYLSIESGADAGSYIISGIGVADGLPNNFTLRLSVALTTVNAALSFVVYDKVGGFVAPESTPFTNIVRIPLSEDDLTDLNRSRLSGFCSLVSTREVVTGKKFVFASLVGQAITLTGGANSGRYILAGVNAAGDGYLITGAFVGTFPLEGVPFSLPPVGSADGRLILVNSKAYTLRRVFNDVNQPLPPLGPGPVSLGVLDRAVLPSGLEDVTWKVPAVLVSRARVNGELIDYEEQGVHAGDLLVFDVEHLDTSAHAEVTGTVVGVDRNRIGFDMGVEAFVPGKVSEPTDAEKIELSAALQISGASLGVTGDLELESTALDIDTALRSLLFRSSYHDLPLWSSTIIEVAGRQFRISVKRVVRNTGVPVDDRVISIPCLREYISSPIVAVADGKYALITRDGERLERSYGPVTLTENDDYIVDAEVDIRGTDGVTAAGSSVFTAAAGFFVSRNVESGDVLSVADTGYVIVQVLSETQLQVLNENTGLAFTQTLSSLTWFIRRTTPGKFLRFIPGLFTPKAPAPDQLWSEVTLIDNYEAIERNFGLMVALAKEDLTNRNTSSTTYREAVLALMYAWASGPKVDNVRLGAQILMGLPVADVKGVILDIDDAFASSPDLGRIIVEDVDVSTGAPTGLVRLYFFPPLSASSLADYAGLETNPATGQLYQVGDIVERFAPLSKGVIVTDYVDNPLWWRGQFLQGDEAAELRKYHTWTLKAAAGVIDDADFDMAAEFARTIDPVWTDVRPVLVLPLADTIQIQDELLFHITEYLVDDPFGSIEATARANDRNGSSYLLNMVGVGPLSSRMMFSGDDLVIPAGAPEPVTFTSARGGFQDPIAVAPHPGFPVVPVDHGSPLVRPGDLLYVSDAPNRGWYSVNTVDSDTSMTVVQQTNVPLDSPTTDELQAQTGASFFVFRLSRNPITSGTGAYVGTTDLFTDTDTCFFTEGVTVDDTLVLLDGAGRGVYTIVEVVDPGAGIYPWDVVRVTPDIVGAPGANLSDFLVRRASLRVNPLMTGVKMISNAGSNILTQTAADFDLQELRTYDEVVIENAPNAGRYQILDVLSDTQIYVRPALPATSGDNDYSIVRQSLSDTVLQLGRVADFFPYEEVTLTLLRPRTTVLSTLADVTVAVTALDLVNTPLVNEARTEVTSAASNFGAVWVAGDVLEIGTLPTLLASDKNTGVWPILSAALGVVTVPLELETSAVPTMARLLRDTADFTVAAVPGSVDSAIGGFVDVGVIPGDRFEVFSGPLQGTYIVAEVVNNSRVLLTDTSVGAGVVVGRIYRLVR